MSEEIKDQALEGYGDEAFAPPGEHGLSRDQLAVRIRAKTEQAAQDTGQITYPQPDEPEDSTVTEEPPVLEPEVEEAEEEPPEEEEPEDTEASVEDEEDDEAPDQDDDFYIGRYRNREEAEKGLAEKDATILELYRERNERWMREQREAQQPQSGPQQLDVEAWNEWAEEMVENGVGARGAAAALEQGDQQGFDIYMAHWLASPNPDERVKALAFNNEVQRQYAAQRAIQAVSPQIEEAQKRSVEDEALHARQSVSSKYADFEQYKDEMDRLIIEDGVLSEDDRVWLARLAQEGPEGKVRSWEYLYMVAKANGQPKREQARAVERRRRTTAADAAKLAATVSTSEGTGSRTPPNETEMAALRKRNAIRVKLGQPPLDEP